MLETYGFEHKVNALVQTEVGFANVFPPEKIYVTVYRIIIDGQAFEVTQSWWIIENMDEVKAKIKEIITEHGKK